MGDYLGAEFKNPLGQELKNIAGICEWPFPRSDLTFVPDIFHQRKRYPSAGAFNF